MLADFGEFVPGKTVAGRRGAPKAHLPKCVVELCLRPSGKGVSIRIVPSEASLGPDAAFFN